MSDATRRGLRTALQLIVTLLTNGAAFGLLAALDVSVTLEQYGAATAVLLPVVTAGLNALEDAGTIPALLKAPASPGATPVPEPDPDELATAQVRPTSSLSGGPSADTEGPGGEVPRQ